MNILSFTFKHHVSLNYTDLINYIYLHVNKLFINVSICTGIKYLNIDYYKYLKINLINYIIYLNVNKLFINISTCIGIKYLNIDYYKYLKILQVIKI